jgi:hypothetical protein
MALLRKRAPHEAAPGVLPKPCRGRFDSARAMDKQPIPIGEQIITIVLLVIFALVIWYGAMI